jgi:hypothetical protein
MGRCLWPYSDGGVSFCYKYTIRFTHTNHLLPSPTTPRVRESSRSLVDSTMPKGPPSLAGGLILGANV